MAWIDSDILFAGQPDGLILSEDEDFAGRYDPIMASVEVNSAKKQNLLAKAVRSYVVEL